MILQICPTKISMVLVPLWREDSSYLHQAFLHTGNKTCLQTPVIPSSGGVRESPPPKKIKFSHFDAYRSKVVLTFHVPAPSQRILYTSLQPRLKAEGGGGVAAAILCFNNICYRWYYLHTGLLIMIRVSEFFSFAIWKLRMVRIVRNNQSCHICVIS